MTEILRTHETPQKCIKNGDKNAIIFPLQFAAVIEFTEVFWFSRKHIGWNMHSHNGARFFGKVFYLKTLKLKCKIFAKSTG